MNDSVVILSEGGGEEFWSNLLYIYIYIYTWSFYTWCIAIKGVSYFIENWAVGVELGIP